MLFSTLQLVLETHRSLSQFCISCGGLPMLHALLNKLLLAVIVSAFL